MLAAGLIVSRFVHYAAVLTLFGAALFPLYTRPRPDAPDRLFAWLRPVLAWSAALALASGVGWFALTAASMAGALAGAVDPQVLISVVRATDFGPLWLARLALLALIAPVVLLRPASALGSWTTPALAALALASLAGTGHARTPDGWAGALHVLADAVHLIGAGVWLGGLLPLGAALAWADRDRSPDDRAVGEMLVRFSGVGALAVAALVTSGLVNSLFLVGSIGRLTGTTYGRLLLVKVALFATMALLAAANRFWITPRLAPLSAGETAPWLRRLRRHVLAEQALGLAVIAVVSVLGTLQPAIEA